MDEEKSPWQYKSDNGQLDDEPAEKEPKPAQRQRRSNNAQWEAPEFIAHPHGAGWFMELFLITIGLAALTYFLANDAFASVIIVILGIIVGVFATQQPNQAKYEISSDGLSVNGKFYSFSNYKSFTTVDEGAFSSVNLFPIKRFMPPLSVYFDASQAKKITDALGDSLPYEERKLDSIERLTRRLRI
jgi:hypothetical protein